jgi:anti-sigma factor RsiW
MPHADIERLHRYLTGALEPAERETLEAHLAGCPDCSLALAQQAAEDAFLADALALDVAERAWIESVDLVEPVMAQVVPRFRPAPPVILTSLLILVAGYLAGSIWSVGASFLNTQTSPAALVDLLHDLLPRLARLVAWLLKGGLLPTIWPTLAIAGLAGLWRLTRTKETNHYA